MADVCSLSLKDEPDVRMDAYFVCADVADFTQVPQSTPDLHCGLSASRIFGSVGTCTREQSFNVFEEHLLMLRL